MNFTTAQKVLDTINASSDVRNARANNRGKINEAANGAPPLSPEEAKKSKMPVNFNTLELTMLFAEARRQFLTAYYGISNFFDVSLKTGSEDKSSSWGKFITNEINEAMMDSLRYYEVNKNCYASGGGARPPASASGMTPTIGARPSSRWRISWCRRTAKRT